MLGQAVFLQFDGRKRLLACQDLPASRETLKEKAGAGSDHRQTMIRGRKEHSLREAELVAVSKVAYSEYEQGGRGKTNEERACSHKRFQFFPQGRAR